jgi:hypothetical protein
MIEPLLDDWRPLRAAIDARARRSADAARLAAWLDGTAPSAVDHIVLLGRLARNHAGAALAAHAVAIAGRQLAERSDARDGFGDAVELAAIRCVDAIDGIVGGAEAPAVGWPRELARAREELEGLAAIGRCLPVLAPAWASPDVLDVVAAADEAAASIDRRADDESVAERAASAIDAGGAAAALAELGGGDDWWAAMFVVAAARLPLAALAPSVGAGHAEHDAAIAAMIAAQLHRADVMARLTDTLAAAIDASRSGGVAGRTAAAARQLADRIDHALARATRTAAPELAAAFALVMTLLDRVDGAVAPGARLPAGIDRLAAVLVIWTRAAPDDPRAERVARAFRATAAADNGTVSAAIAEACAIVAHRLDVDGYRRDSERWRARASRPVPAPATAQASPHRTAEPAWWDRAWDAVLAVAGRVIGQADEVGARADVGSDDAAPPPMTYRGYRTGGLVVFYFTRPIHEAVLLRGDRIVRHLRDVPNGTPIEIAIADLADNPSDSPVAWRFASDVRWRVDWR